MQLASELLRQFEEVGDLFFPAVLHDGNSDPGGSFDEPKKFPFSQ